MTTRSATWNSVSTIAHNSFVSFVCEERARAPQQYGSAAVPAPQLVWRGKRDPTRVWSPMSPGWRYQTDGGTHFTSISYAHKYMIRSRAVRRDSSYRQASVQRRTCYWGGGTTHYAGIAHVSVPVYVGPAFARHMWSLGYHMTEVDSRDGSNYETNPGHAAGGSWLPPRKGIRAGYPTPK